MSFRRDYGQETIRRALENVVGGGDLSTDELADMRDDALAALDELETALVFAEERLDNIAAETRRMW